VLAIQKELGASRVSGSDEILVRAIPCELADSDATIGQYILEQDKPF